MDPNIIIDLCSDSEDEEISESAQDLGRRVVDKDLIDAHNSTDAHQEKSVDPTTPIEGPDLTSNNEDAEKDSTITPVNELENLTSNTKQEDEDSSAVSPLTEEEETD